ncbi:MULTISPECIES: helix-turn-helix domain-containing protein [Halomonadaceae]|uniref:Helix-turn-helix domain-containing protein n=1 Tax=Modicisalibacter zincidurans TaxID=1178777 RepID=A0ABP9R8I0_9GAMM|nr:helix-turn-helix domain-containing protein [Halomonas zincidurans]MCD6009097.1 helix-turn-helix domain-containing protein [Halomonas sp. IOP_31]
MQHLATLASNLKRVRLHRGLTLSGLAQRCGIAKSTLSRMESGQGNPTIDTLWLLADALGVPFGDLVANDGSGPTEPGEFSGQGASVRLIERHDSNPVVETYRLALPAGHIRRSAPHAPGVRERVVVQQGSMLVGDALRPQRLNPGESCEYAADVEHLYGASDEPAVGIVFIEYPTDASHLHLVDQAIDWPDTPQEWEGARSLFHRLAIETSTGLTGSLLRLRHAPKDSNDIGEQVIEHVGLRASDAWPIYCVAGHDSHDAFWAVVPLTTTSAFVASPLEGVDDILDEARRLARLAESPFLPDTSVRSEKHRHSPYIVLDCLTSEVALQRGDIALPGTVTLEAPFNRHATSQEAEAFSSRIDFDHYAAYELVHPAYARQMVAMAEDILAFGGDLATGNAIDIGTGPGTALLMLTELLPRLRVTAVEPDDVAIAHLKALSKGQERIKPHHGDFLALDTPPASQRLLTSVGASHHFNTPFMLKKCQELLQPGGLLCVADEFLPEFHDRETRLRALVLHHSAYILASTACLERADLRAFTADTRSCHDDIRQPLCLAVLEAQRGLVNEAVTRCRSLLSRLNSQGLEQAAHCPLGVFVRFFRLEMQAMVAGFDYEVERKTYTRRFLELARFNGFELLHHRRVFATTGTDDWQGGTHVFTFRRHGGAP